MDLRAIQEHAEAIATIQKRGSWDIGDHVVAAVDSGGDPDDVLQYLVAQVAGMGGDLNISAARWYYQVASEWPADHRHGMSMTAASELLAGKTLSAAERFAIAREHGSRLTKRKARALAGGTSDLYGPDKTPESRALAVSKEIAADSAVIARLLDDDEVRTKIEAGLFERQRSRTGRNLSDLDSNAAEADAVDALRSALVAAKRSVGKRFQAALGIDTVAPSAAQSIANHARDLAVLAQWVQGHFEGTEPLGFDDAIQQLLSDGTEA